MLTLSYAEANEA